MGDHHHHHHDQHGSGSAGLAEILDLDAEVLRSHLSEVTEWIAKAAGRPPRRILDLGSGTGAGTFALLRRFGDAEAIALDQSGELLHHLNGKARDLGLDGRIRTVQADLDAEWPELDPADLVWASASLHHMADPDRVLAGIHALLRPGGLLVAAELAGLPRFLPDDLGFGRPGLEERCHEILDAERAVDVPHMGSDWGPRLAAAGFAIEAERVFEIDMRPPLPAAAARYAEAVLRRMRHGLEGRLGADDLAALDALLDRERPGSVLRRDDLSVRTERTVWIGRR
ncbi:class I SAM-dependent methyltransferase [Spirillospora sp. NPDC029432]|uniref:class I SAM-dependent methyltransferase n=1 Tax=Spirillospora sp. NPDC029432 TaxID=3154599 RepID=UPI00345582E8